MKRITNQFLAKLFLQFDLENFWDLEKFSKIFKKSKKLLLAKIHQNTSKHTKNELLENIF